MRVTAGIETEVLSDHPGELHLFPRETRRGKAQWAVWVKADGSGTLFVNNDQVELPRNASKEERRETSKQVFADQNATLSSVRDALDLISGALTDHGHQWSPVERRAYYSAVREISKYALEQQK